MCVSYSLSGIPDHFLIEMDQFVDNGRRIAHASLNVSVYNNPALVPGVRHNALLLDRSQQYVDIGKHGDKCLGNLDLCPFGISIFFWIKIEEYADRMYIMSTGSDEIQIYCYQGNIYVNVNNKQTSWSVGLRQVTLEEWHFVELTWHPKHGMELFVDGEVHKSRSRHVREVSFTSPNHFYIGRPNPYDVAGGNFNYGAFAVDELEIWYDWRPNLIAWGRILRGTYVSWGTKLYLGYKYP